MDKKAFYRLSYGVYIVSAIKGSKLNGQIANTVFQITSEPPVIAVSINKNNLTHEYIEESKVFSVSILTEDTPMDLIGRFGFRSGRDIDKFENLNFMEGKTGCPILLEHTAGFLEAEVINSVDAGTHTIFLGKVVDAGITGAGVPMTYAYYHRVKGGKAPASAPTYLKDEFLESKGGKKYVCKICGYVYDPEKGDPDGGVPPGTRFEELPEDWTCPICGAGKEDFELQTS